MIAYEIITKEPFRIKECTGGSGGVCGALFLTRNFQDFIHHHLGEHSHLLTAKRLEAAVKYFEGDLKFYFDPYSENCEDFYEVPLRGAPDIPSIGLEEGYLKISKY